MNDDALLDDDRDDDATVEELRRTVRGLCATIVARRPPRFLFDEAEVLWGLLHALAMDDPGFPALLRSLPMGSRRLIYHLVPIARLAVESDAIH